MKKKKIKLIFLILVAILIAATFASLPFLVNVQKIVCMTDRGECSLTLRDYLNQAIGKSYNSTKKLATNASKTFPYIINIKTKFLLPSELRVYYSVREPYAAVYWQNKYFLVDESGVVMEKADQTQLPIMKVNAQKLEVGLAMDANSLKALDLLEQLNHGFDIHEADYGDDKLIVTYKDDIKVIFGIDADVARTLGAFALVLSRLNPTNPSSTINQRLLIPKVIDLRFKNPVLKYNE